MLTISRMKAMINSKFAAFSSHRAKLETSSLSFPPLLYELTLYSNPFHFKPNFTCSMSTTTPLLPNTSLSLTQIRSIRMEPSRPPPGEIGAIVGHMFASKTTSLLRRIQLEIRNGSFQVQHHTRDLKLDKVLRGLCVSGRLAEAIGLLCCTELPVDPGTYSLLLQECIYRKEYKKGRRIHAQMVVVGYAPIEYLRTKLLIMYMKSGNHETAEVFFNSLLEKSLIAWNAMISGYVQNGFEEMGLNLFYRMRQTGLKPDQYSFASVFRACASMAALEPGKQAHGLMVKCHIRENVIVNSALIDMYFKCSSICDGHQVFNKCSNKNVVTWTSLISGYGQHGRVSEVLESFQTMRSEGLTPNYITFLAVLSACSHGGLVYEGREYFKSMKRDYRIQPRGQHYAVMVDILGRAGKLQEAYDFVCNSPYKEHSAVWGALIGACKIHSDVELLKIAANKYFELDKENAGKYVVMANAFASFGLWDNAAEVRAVMSASGLVKVPAYSRIEVQREVHFFFKGDKLHRLSDEIYKLIKDMNLILKDAIFTPDLNETCTLLEAAVSW